MRALGLPVLGALAIGCSDTAPVWLLPAAEVGPELIIAALDREGQPLAGSPWRELPGALEVPASAFPVQFFTRRYLRPIDGGPDLEACELGHGGIGSRPRPSAAWTTGPIDEDASGASFEPELEPWRELDLRLQGECARSLCDRVELETHLIQGPEDAMDIASVAALDATHALLFGNRDFQTHLFTLESPGGITRHPEVSLGGELGQAAGDRRGGALIRAPSGTVFELDQNGMIRGTIEPGFPTVGLTVGLDGSAFVYSSDRIAALTLGSTVAVPLIAQPRPGIMKVHAVSKDRMVSVGESGIDYFDGTRWTPELLTSLSNLDNRVAVAGDEFVYYVQEQSGPRIRNETTGAWEGAPVPLSTSVPRTAVALGRGRILIGGQTGGLALYEHGEWCKLPTRTSAAIIASDLSPDRRAAFVSSWSREDTTWVFRLQLP